MTASASVYALCGGMDLREEDVTKWLGRMGALRVPGRAAANGAAGTERSSSEVAASRDLLLMHGVNLRA